MSNAPKVAVIYCPCTGTVHELAQAIASGAEAGGAEVRIRNVAELAPRDAITSNPAREARASSSTRRISRATLDDVVWADAIIFGGTAGFGDTADQLKRYIDTLGGLWAQGRLADKVYSGFTADSTARGGREPTLLALYNTVRHFGGIIVTPGYTGPVGFADGIPYDTSQVGGQGSDSPDDTTRAAAAFQGERVARLTAGFKIGLATGRNRGAGNDLPDGPSASVAEVLGQPHELRSEPLDQGGT